MSRKKAFYLIGIAIGLCFSSYCCAAESGSSAFLFTEADKAQVRTYLEAKDYEAIVRMVPQPSDFHDDAPKGDCFRKIMLGKLIAHVMLDDPESALEIGEYLFTDSDVNVPRDKNETISSLYYQGLLHCLCDNYGLAIDSFQKAVKLDSDSFLKYILHRQLAYLYAYTKKFDKAREEVKILESLYPEFVDDVLKLVEGSSADQVKPFRTTESQIIDCIEQPDKKQIHRLRFPQKPAEFTNDGALQFDIIVFWDYIDMFEIENSEESK
ncbi:MAG: tetratricopeptide repeat protein [Thermoguttaceae bacterium]